MNQLRIAEVFASLQGEGIWTGVSSTFVRVSGCNLRCRWCDTPYASFRPEGEVRSVQEILKEVSAHGHRHVVVTGGEPMIFAPVEDLCKGLRAQGRTITIETAGTEFRDLECDLMSISPKLSNSTPRTCSVRAPFHSATEEWRRRHEARRLNLEPLRRLLDRYECQLKFVVNPEDSESGDFEEIEQLLSELGGRISPDRILLMPEGTESVALRRRETQLAAACIERGWRLSPRMHIHWFGNKRGT